MNTFPPPAIISAAVLALGGLLGTGVAESLAADAAAPRLVLRGDTTAGEVEVLWGAQRLMLYTLKPHQFKPYISELYTVRGDNVLRDAPLDHLHHHGLMYAIRVNGINFWEETGAPGYQRTVQLTNRRVGKDGAGRPQASFRHLIHWVSMHDKGHTDTSPVALLVENRTLTLTVDPDTEEVALEWRSDFEVGRKAPQVELSGADYHGLGLRFPASFDKSARHLNAANLPYPTQGKRDVLEARWAAVTGTVNARAATVAVFGRPEEQKGPLKFFSMLDPFTYLSATQGLDKTPITYARGERFSLRYLIAVYPRAMPAETLSRRDDDWRASTAKKAR